MRSGVVCAVAVVSWLCGAGPAWAQAERGFIRGLGGAVFGTADPSWLIGGGGGIAVGSNVHITGEVGRLGDVLPSEMRDELELLADLLAIELGVPVSLGLSAPTTYVLGGVRIDGPGSGRARPFVEGQFGIARVSFDIEAEVEGIDISDEVEAEAGFDSESELMLGLGGGIAIALAEALGLDVGYRYGRLFTDNPAINSHAAYAAIRVLFR